MHVQVETASFSAVIYSLFTNLKRKLYQQDIIPLECHTCRLSFCSAA